MKKALGFMAFGLLLAGFSSLALAEEPKEAMSSKEMAPAGMMGQGMMSKDKMMGTCACPMMKGSLIATQDGGVILMIGNKLQKYDKDLVLKKEVEVKVDMESMRKMMESCPMMSAMAESPKTETGEAKAH